VIRLVAVIELEGQAPRALQHESSSRSIIIGRDASADFQIPLSTISRQHARISESDNVYTVEDLGSTHGTLLNGKKLIKGDKRVLRDSDILELTKAKVTCTIESDKIVAAEPGEGTQAMAAKAVQGILGRLGDAHDDGPYLRVLNGPDEGVRFPFVGTLSQWALGRSRECEFILNDPNVSRRHAMIKRDWNGFVVHDLGSKNGVQINEHSINKPYRLQDRDQITIGPIQLVYVDPNADLMAALKDVPGFETGAPEHESEGESLDLGMPGAQSDAVGSSDLTGGSAAGDGLSNPNESEEDDAYAHIDPLLLEVKRGPPIEWILIALGAAIAVVVILAIALLI
jgi:pSer/pThr/pTyr-binding forkhead associated (FHA) protein